MHMYLRTVALIQYFWLDVVGKSGNVAEYSKTFVRDTDGFLKEKKHGIVLPLRPEINTVLPI